MNIGSEGVRAVQELRGNPHFEAFRLALGNTACDYADRAIESPIEQRIEQTGYARALRDLWRAIESASTGQHVRTIKAPRKGALAAAPAEEII